MNELKLVYGIEDWFYFKTEAETVIDALADLTIKFEKIGVNFDNMIWEEAVLRDANGNDIDKEAIY